MCLCIAGVGGVGSGWSREVSGEASGLCAGLGKKLQGFESQREGFWMSAQVHLCMTNTVTEFHRLKSGQKQLEYIFNQSCVKTCLNISRWFKNHVWKMLKMYYIFGQSGEGRLYHSQLWACERRHRWPHPETVRPAALISAEVHTRCRHPTLIFLNFPFFFFFCTWDK